MQLLQPWLNCQWVRGATNIYCHQLCFIYMFYITLIPCQASCQVCLLTYGGCVNSPSFDDIWQTSPAIHPPRHLVLHLSHVCEINTNAFFLFFKDNFSYETAAGQQHLRCRKQILAQTYYSMISHNSEPHNVQILHGTAQFTRICISVTTSLAGLILRFLLWLRVIKESITHATPDTLFPRHVTQAGGCEIGRSSDDLISVQN